MGKKKFCQELKISRPLDAVETRLYGWVEEAVLTQPFVVESDSLPEFCRNYPLMEDSGAEGDYVSEAVGPSDRVPFRAGEDGPHFLWVYQELFTRLRMRLPFSDFQRDVMTRCRVAVSQLHLNGWGIILAFEKVCLHYGFRPTIRLFFYIYDVHFPPGGYGYISFRARQGRKLFDSYEDSIQEFKWHYFKVLAAPGRRAFWLDHENKPFSWVYWNPEPKRNKLTCRWILDGSDAEVGKFLDDLLDVKMKRTKLDDLMAKMADRFRMGPRAVLPTGSPSATATAAAAVAVASASVAAVPPASTASEIHRTKKQSSKRDRVKVVNLEDEEGLQEDPAADLQKKQWRKKAKVDEAFEKALRDDSAWEHDVDPLQVGVETSLAAKVKAKKELSAALDQFEVLKGERDSALLYLPLKEKVDTLDDQLSERTAEYQSALDRITLLEKDNRVLKTQFESSQLSLEGKMKRSDATEKQVGSLTASLKTSEADLSKAVEASEYWRAEWQQLGFESQ
ncbi:hypothetical protein PIB30_018621 [Stylosanthes scabra]|uniref:Transposase (putative) gypsy type domain-containing protein n=1 Tax=Stylosanthes scabra TaxID=79078 RepID=A0ABU6TA35_9FABA|nr:hypothetical protein [Stylosanthes scabra]